MCNPTPRFDRCHDAAALPRRDQADRQVRATQIAPVRQLAQHNSTQITGADRAHRVVRVHDDDGVGPCDLVRVELLDRGTMDTWFQQPDLVLQRSRCHCQVCLSVQQGLQPKVGLVGQHTQRLSRSCLHLWLVLGHDGAGECGRSLQD
jgi:hypothetical protein